MGLKVGGYGVEGGRLLGGRWEVVGVKVGGCWVEGGRLLGDYAV